MVEPKQHYNTCHTPFSIAGMCVGVAAPVCKVHVCVMLPLVGTVTFQLNLHSQTLFLVWGSVVYDVI